MALTFLAMFGLLTVAVLKYADGVQLQAESTTAGSFNNGVAQAGAGYLQVDSSRVDSQGCVPGNSGSITFNGGSDKVAYKVTSGGCTNLISGCVICLNPGANFSANLNAVDAVANNQIWAVGDSCTILFSGDGSTWSPVPAGGCSGFNLTGMMVVDNSHGWIVGSSSDGTTGIVLVCSANCNASTASWQVATTPSLPALTSVTAAKPGPPDSNDWVVWAVGSGGTVVYCANAGGCNSASSTFVKTTPAGLTGYGLNGVATFDGGEAWVAGWNGSAGIVAVCISFANCTTGGTWTPRAATTVKMSGIQAQANALVYAVGDSGTILACVASCNTAAAVFAPPATTGAGTTNLTSVFVQDNNHAWVAGAGGFIDFCSSNCNKLAGDVWAPASVLSSKNLAAIDGSDANHVWAVGATATILFYPTADIWGPQLTATDPLNAIDVIDNQTAVAVGNKCSVAVTSDGLTWSVSTIAAAICPTGTTLTGVDIVDQNDGWAVGSGGLILVCTAHCDLTGGNPTWAKLTTEPTTQNLTAVTAAKQGGPTGDWLVVAVGAGGTEVYCAVINTSSCSTAAATFTVKTPAALSGYALNGVATVDGSEAWVVGWNGTSGIVAVCTSLANCTSGATWVSRATPGAQMNAVSAQANNLVYTAGNAGTILVCITNCNQATASFVAPANTGFGTTNLTGVWVKDNGHAWVVGPNGFIDFCSNHCADSTSQDVWGTPTQFTTIPANFAAVNGNDPNHVWAVGANGTSGVILFPGNGFGPQAAPAKLGVGAGTITAQGDVAVNGGINVSSGAGLTASQPSGSAGIFLTGGATCTGSCSPSPQPLSGSLTPPLNAPFPSPALSAAPSTDVTLTNSSSPLAGELYYHNITVSTNQKAHLSGGRYVITGTLDVQAGASLVNDSNGTVVLYFACTGYPSSCSSPGAVAATLNVEAAAGSTPGGSLSLLGSPNTPSSQCTTNTTSGGTSVKTACTIIFDPNTIGQITVGNGANLSSVGAIDAPSALMNVGSTATVSVLGLVVVNYLTTSATTFAVNSCYTYSATIGDLATPARQGQANIQPDCSGNAGIFGFDYSTK